MTVKAPWARDVAGKSLPTSYTFAAGQITQNVDTTGATFPVVADPTVTSFVGIFKQIHFNRAETLRVAGVVGAANKGIFACEMVSSVLVNPVFGGRALCFEPAETTQIAASADAAARTSALCLRVNMRRDVGMNTWGDRAFYVSSATKEC